MNPSPKPPPVLKPSCSNPQNRNRTAFGTQAETPALLLSITGLPGLIEIRQRRTATCSGTQPAIELGFGLPPLPEKAWRARAFLPGLASHRRRRSVQKALVDSAKSYVNEAVVLICSNPNRCIILIGETHWTTGRPIPENGRDMLECPKIRYTLEALHQLDPQARILVEYSGLNTGPVTEQCVPADILTYKKQVERFDVRHPDASVKLHTAQTPEQYIYALNKAREKHHSLCLR